MKTPQFWDKKNSLAALILGPLSRIWDYGVRKRIEKGEINLPLHTICVGNAVMGGAGKTPTALALYDLLQPVFKEIHFVTRGYGRKKCQVMKASPHHSYKEVGDEAILLSRKGTTWVGAQRNKSLSKCVEKDAKLVISDDGFFNPIFNKAFKVIVVDAQQGFGNGKIFPAGPLRASLDFSLKRADLVVLVSYHQNDPKERNFADYLSSLTTFVLAKAQIKIPEGQTDYVAFCGIGYPEKFRKSLENKGLTLKKFITFPDHYAYTDHDLTNLINLVKQENCRLITTEKDFCKIPSQYHDEIDQAILQLTFEKPKQLAQQMIDYFART